MATHEDLVHFLEVELQRKGWKPADLARNARISEGVLSRILNRERNASPETLVSLAKALKKPPEHIFRIAGLLPPKGGVLPTIEEVEHKFALLSEEAQQQALDYMNFLLEKQEKEARSAQDRKDLAPTEQ